MFIDIHVHFRRILGMERSPGRQSYCTPEQLIERYDEMGVEKAVVLPGVSPECSYVPQCNEEVIEIAKQTGRFIPFCNVDPRALTNSPTAPLHKLLGHYKDQGCKGLGEVTANLPILHPMVQNLFRCAEDVGLPLTFHLSASTAGGLYGIYDDPGLPQLEQSLRRFPKLKFFGHSQTFWAEMAPLETVGDRWGYPKGPVNEEGAVPWLFRRYENLYGDLSAGSGHNALARDEDYAIQFINEFQDRLFFGTDFTYPDQAAPLREFLLRLREEKKISEDVFQKIARENAVRVLEL